MPISEKLGDGGEANMAKALLTDDLVERLRACVRDTCGLDCPLEIYDTEQRGLILRCDWVGTDVVITWGVLSLHTDIDSLPALEDILPAIT